ncbi:transcription factor 25 [Stemphylium lycopersici]|nr:transcription factor 25 [Stemphylium lycopersici]
MSSRALRRAQRELEEKQIQKRLAQDSQDEEESEPEVASKSTAKPSLFAMLGDGGDDNDDGEDDGDDDGDAEPDVKPDASNPDNQAEPESTPAPKPSKKSKKKKKKAKAKGKATATNQSDAAAKSKPDLDEIDQALLALNLTANGQRGAESDHQDVAISEEKKQLFSALSVDTQHLHSANEMKKLFGRAALQNNEEEARPRQRGQQGGIAAALAGRNAPGNRNLASLSLRRNVFIQGKEEWPRATSGGLGMEVVEKRADGTAEYKFVHNRTYQDVQRQFQTCVASMDPERMIALLQHNPFHISTLLQVSEIAKQQRENAAASDMLERALFTFGRSVHSTFATNLAAGKARLDFRRPENREFWLAVWRYLGALSTRATWRTSFEWAKLLLAMDPEHDPYCIRLLIDQLALRGRDAEGLVNLVEADYLQRQWKVPPNLAYGVALAHDRMKEPQKARSALRNAIKEYPWLAARLCKELDISPIPKPVWGKEPNSDYQELLCQMYVPKAKDLWNTTEGTTLLVEICYSFEEDLGAGEDPYWLAQIPEDDLARHVILSDNQALMSLLDVRVKSKYTSVSDPLPPDDNVESYDASITGIVAGRRRDPAVRQQLLADLEQYREYFERIGIDRLMQRGLNEHDLIEALEEANSSVEEFRNNTEHFQHVRMRLEQEGVQIVFDEQAAGAGEGQGQGQGEGTGSETDDRLRSSSLSAVPPPQHSSNYSHDLAKIAASILYRSPLPSQDGRPVFILNAAALPDSHDADYDQLLPYVLARLPEEDELLKGYEYEVVFFAGDGDGSATNKKHRPGWGWFLQAYHVLSRAMRKRLQRLYIVHEKAWVRILTEIFSTIVSPKFRRKIYHLSNLTQLSREIPIENLLIPPSTYLADRRISENIAGFNGSGRRAFGTRSPFPVGTNGRTRFPRVLRETTSFVLMEKNITSEGLFRVPPHSRLRDSLKEAYDRGQKYIIWKDNETMLPVPPYPHAQHQDDILAEVVPTDAYSVYMAAALIKAWYASLRQPIFPTDSYRDLRRLYGDSQDILELDKLTDLFSPNSEWSLLPGISRELLCRHLLPLMSAIAARQEENKMTAENLAVCFAPGLLCGPDQLEDAKMSSIIRRIFTHAIDMWSDGLREACGQNEEAFYAELKLPRDQNDWEDPAEPKRDSLDSKGSIEDQMGGITLLDNEKFPTIHDTRQGQEEEVPPPLPPRTRAPSAKSSGDSVPRKPAPPLTVPPRYSTVVSDAPDGVAESPITYAATTDGFAPPRNHEDSIGQSSNVPSKWNGQSDEKKSGTSSPVPVLPMSTSTRADDDARSQLSASSLASQPNIPRRKTLTATQIDNVDKAVVAQHEAHRAHPMGGMALPGLTGNYNNTSGAKRGPSSTTTYTGNDTATSPLMTSPQSAVSAPATEFRRPSVPFSTTSSTPGRSPSINSLARPVFPTTPHVPIISHPVPHKSSTLPVPAAAPRLRTPSPSLMQRMPSFENFAKEKDTGEAENGVVRGRTLKPTKVNLKKQSVEHLRRLYEERAGTASVLVQAGKQKNEA